jgi:KaiC/GvpD/RAD55 family RecA-like ATPase
MFDTLIETETKIAGKTKAMARAKEALEPVIEDFEEGLEDLGIMPKILKGAFASRLPSGIPGFDEMLHGGIPNGASIIVQGATGGEKEMFANQFLAEGLRSDGTTMVAISMISPNEWRNQMKTVKAKTRKYEKEGQVVIVDWYTHKNERVRSVEVKGPVILSSKSITNLEIAIDKAIKVIRDGPTKRAVIAILSPAIKALGFDKVFGFAQSIRGKFKKYGITGLFLLEKKMHDDKILTSLHSVFDGVFDIERQRQGDTIVRKIGILSLKGSPCDSSYRELELTRTGLMVKAKESGKQRPKKSRGSYNRY